MKKVLLFLLFVGLYVSGFIFTNSYHFDGTVTENVTHGFWSLSTIFLIIGICWITKDYAKKKAATAKVVDFQEEEVEEVG